MISDSYGEGLSPRTLRELEMAGIMQEITEKPNWIEKINKKEITNKWKEEIKEKIEGKVNYLL